MNNLKQKQPLSIPKPPSRKEEIIYSYIFLKNLTLKYKWILAGVVITFILGFIFALIAPNDLKSSTLISVFDEFSKFGAEQTTIFFSIFFNNLRVTIMNFILGFSVIIPLLILFYNGFLIGVFFDFMSRISSIGATNQPILLLLISILPHGIIEIPTLIFSTFISVLVGLKMIFNKKIEKHLSRKNFLIQIIKVYIFVFLPLLMLAAIIESFLSYSLTATLFTSQIKKDFTLNNLILKPSDFKQFGITAQEKNSDNFNHPKDSLFSLNQIIAYIYDEDIYKLLKEDVKPKHTITMLYKLHDNSYFSIQIQSFASEKDAEIHNNLSIRALNLLALKNKKFTINNLNDNLYKARFNNNVAYLKYGIINNYTLSLSYRGNDLEDLNKIFDLQLKKISEKNK